MNIKVLENIKIHGSKLLSIEDFSVLTLLYQPLVLPNAYALFLSMYELVRNDKFTYQGVLKHLLHLMNLNLKEFDEALSKLEAVGLLTTYYAEEKGYLFDLNHPLTANEFLKDGSLGIYLYSEIGEDQFKVIQKQFKISSRIPSEFNNVTRTFDDVFAPSHVGESISGAYQKRKPATLQFASNFDFGLFESFLSKTFYTKNQASDKLKDMIVKLAFTYDLKEEDMSKAYMRSLSSDGEVNYLELPKETRKQYQYKTEQDAPRLTFKMTESQTEGLLGHLKSIQPKALLEELSGMEPPSTELDLVFKLYHNNHLKPEVINLMLYYVLKLNNGKMPTYTYFSKIANEWGRQNLNTIEEVYAYILKQNKEPRQSKAKQPTWAKELKEERRKKDKEETFQTSEVDLEAISNFFQTK